LKMFFPLIFLPHLECPFNLFCSLWWL
jgi:hypothetical protein